ncbi:efflux RND transporter permease subunit [Alienimonas californiensis]|uniref:Cation efflux system protein CusA n=1 Tax=Alienimonas californiensis TaxID=2527989 RepID=A0A517PB49_9PLAN|nr:efflux RND transporter permease subunit [Alienimonas californiensis]QDT16598.1 Cation efflux system protein CusA [Alienimonas californiensis]
MLAALVRFCVREPLIVLLLTAGLIGFGVYSVNTVPIDAIPDIGENQVIVLTDWPGRSPKDVEDQITYPLSVNLLAVPGAESVRGKSLFGVSFVQVTFDDSVDFYWARSRVSEQLGVAAASLPDGVTPRMGPDATGLGQIYYYVLEPPPGGGMNLAELRSLQDFVVRYELQAVEGVSEVAGIGGYVRQYQVDVDPDRLRFHQLPLDRVTAAVRAAGRDVGAKTVESGGMEYIVRGRGFVGGGDDGDAVRDLEETVVAERGGVPVRLKDVADVQLGPDFRRGALDLNGAEAVGGVVVMRYGENPRAVIDRVKEKIRQIEPSLNGVTIRGVYDRSGLIDETIATLATALWEEIAITAAVILLFLLHIRSSLTVAATLPVAVLLAFGAMRVGGVDANIMSLAGIAIAIGTMVDMGIIVSENIYQHLASWTAGVRDPGDDRTRVEVIEEAAGEVAPAVFTAVMTTVVSFLPVFFLTGRDHKLFAPLAWTKTFSIVAALIVAVCLVPPICRLLLGGKQRSRWTAAWAGLAGAAVFAGSALVWGGRAAAALSGWLFPGGGYAVLPVHVVLAAATIGFAVGYQITREHLRPVDENPVSRFIVWIYEPTLRFFLRHKIGFLTVPALIVLLGLGAWFGLGTVLKPVERGASHLGADLNAVPGYLEAKSQFMGLSTDDWIALDEGSWFYMPTLYPAASFSEAMRVLQTQDVLIRQIPEVEDVLGKIGRVDSALDPAPAAMVETYVMLKPRDLWRPGVTSKDVWEEINAVATLPGVTPASPLQPIEGRVVMLQSGIKAPTAVRIYGDDLGELAAAARAVAARLKDSPYVNAGTVNPDIVLGKPYVEFAVDRETAARYGMSVEMVNRVIETALGGMNVDRTVEGRERYPVRVRYRRDLRERIDDLGELPVVAYNGQTVPLSELATLTTTWGPGAISSENARLVAHVAFATSGAVGDLEAVAAIEESLRDAAAKPAGDPDALTLPAGYSFELVGSFRNQIEANRRLMWLVPLVIGINLLLIYFQFRAVPLTLAVFAGIPVAFGGGMICLALAGTEMNTAVWVGFIALFGIAVDDGVVIATYLDQVFTRRRLRTVEDIRAATVVAGARRIRPCLMTTATTVLALVPVLLSDGRGADVARAMALPVFGGMTVELVTLFVVPVLFCGFKEFKLKAGLHDRHWAGTEDTPTEDLDEPAAARLSPATV